MATEGISEAEIKDELEYCLSDYEKELKDFKIEFGWGVLEIGLRGLEFFLHPNPESILHTILAVTNGKINFAAGEKLLPSRQISYVYKVQKAFGAR